MNFIYLVTSGKYSDYYIERVYNDRTIAQKWIDLQFKEGSQYIFNEKGYYSIEKRILNPPDYIEGFLDCEGEVIEIKKL